MSGKKLTRVVPADEAGIEAAAETLTAGGLVALPTETVYGLAARADDADAVSKIYAAKGRPDVNPLIVHVRDLQHALEFAHFDATARDLAARYWPGPLTLVLPVLDSADVASRVTAGLPTIALRVSAHPVVRRVLESVGFAIAAPSANASGFISPTSASHVVASLDGKIDLVLDGGSCAAGVESTILAVRKDGSIEELRPGPVPSVAEWGSAVNTESIRGEQIEAPGQLTSHYSPGKPVRLDVRHPGDDEFLIGFGEIAGHISLSQSGDVEEAAARLYDCLHRAKRSHFPKIAVAPVPYSDVGIAINDRLLRAATPATGA